MFTSKCSLAKTAPIKQRRTQIIEAAVEVFLESGFDRASMTTIAKHSGVSKQTLYSHFGSKENLFREAINEACRQHTPTALIAAQKLAPRDALLEIGRELCALLFSDDALRLESLCVAGASKHPEVSNIFWQAGPEWIRATLSEFFSSLMDKGQLKPADSNLIAKQFIALMCGEHRIKALMGIGTVKDNELQKIVEDATDLIIAAYAA